MKTRRKNILFYFVLSCLFPGGFLYAMKPKKSKSGAHRFIKELFAKKKKNIDAKDKDGNTLLVNLCRLDNKKQAAQLIKKGADVNMAGQFNYTPLLWACANENIPLVKLLISKKTAINVQDSWGKTPLFWACVNNGKRLAELLIKNGADIRAKNKKGDTLLIALCKQPNIDIALIEFLIDEGAYVNAKDKHEDTPLILACYKGDKELVKLLIKKGADVNSKNKKGVFPLMVACLSDCNSLAEILIERGANVNEKDKNCLTSLIWLCCRNNKKLVELLIAKGANVNAEDNCGHTPLGWAEINENNDLARFLVEAGADIGNLHKSDEFRKLFQEERQRYSLLNGEIEKLKNELDSDKDYLLPMREEIEKIDELMLDPRTPLFAKQSALPYLLRYHRIYPKRIPENKLLAYYKETLFNYRFFTDNRFKQVLEFAIKVGAKDKKDRSVLDAALVGGKCYQRAMAKLLEMTDLSSSPQTYDVTVRDKQKKVPNKCRYMLKLAKNMNRKKLGKSLMNIAICSYYLESKTPLPSEMVSSIMSFVKL